MAEVKVLDQKRVPSLDPARKGKDDLVVTYSLNGTRGYLIRVPADGAGEQTVIDAIRKDLAARAALVGRTFSV